MCLHVALEVVRHQVVVSVLGDAVDKGTELTRIAKHALTNDAEDTGELRVELEARVGVGVAQVLDVLGEVAEEEDVVFADLSSSTNAK